MTPTTSGKAKTTNGIMKVLFVNHVSTIGGAEQSMLELIPALCERGVTPLLAAPKGPLLEAADKANIATREITFGRMHRPRNIADAVRVMTTFARATRQLRSIALQEEAQCIHANGLVAALPCANAAAKLRIPSFWHCRDTRLPGTLLRRIARTQSIAIAISRTVERALLAQAPSIAMRLCRNAIDTARYAPPDTPHDDLRRHFRLPAEGRVILVAGHLVPWKRHGLAIKSFCELRRIRNGVHLAIAGDDLFGEHAAYVASLKQLVAQKGLDASVHWLGEVNDMPALYKAADLLLHTADNEPFGRVICEAMAAGCPVVSVSGGGPEEIITHEIDGYIAEDHNATALGQFVRCVLDEPKKTARMIAEARKKVVREYDVERLGEQLAGLYATHIRERAGVQWSENGESE